MIIIELSSVSRRGDNCLYFYIHKYILVLKLLSRMWRYWHLKHGELKLHTCILMTKGSIHIIMEIIHIVLGNSFYVITDQLQKNSPQAATFPLYDGKRVWLNGSMSGNSVWPYTYRLTSIQPAKTERRYRKERKSRNEVN